MKKINVAVMTVAFLAVSASIAFASPMTEARSQMNLANKIIEDIEVSTREQRFDEIAGMLKNYQIEIEAAMDNIEIAFDKNQDTEYIADTFKDNLYDHRKKLDSVSRKVPKDLKDTVKSTREFAKKIRDRAKQSEKDARDRKEIKVIIEPPFYPRPYNYRHRHYHRRYRR